jgi:hypothetical protein
VNGGTLEVQGLRLTTPKKGRRETKKVTVAEKDRIEVTAIRLFG